MALTERLALLITADGKGAIREFDKVGKAAERSLGSAEGRIDRVGATMVSVGSKMMVGGAIVGAAMWKMGQSAANAGEQADWASRVFGDSFDAVDEWAQGASKSAALSTTAAHEAASGFGALLNATGKTKPEIAEMSIGFSQLAADMSSAKNVPLEQSLGALQSALAGQTRPLRQFGVNLDEATLKQRALDMGLIATTSGTLPAAIRMQASYAEIMDQTTDMQGNFADTSDTVANRQKTMAAEWSNLTDQIGEGFLPVMQGVVGAASGVIGVLGTFDSATGGLLGTLGTGVTVIGLFGGSILFVAGKVIKLRANIIQATASTKAFIATHKMMGAAAAGGAVAAGAAAGAWFLWTKGVTEARQEGERFSSQFLDPVNQQIAEGQLTYEQYQTVMSNTAEQIGVLADEFDSYSATQVTARNQVNSVRDALIDQHGAMGENEIRGLALAEATGANVMAAIEWVTAQELAGQSFHNSEQELAAFNRAQLESAGVAPDAAAGVADLGQEFVDAELAIEQAKQELKEWTDALRAQFDPLFAQASALDGVRDAQDKAAEAARDLVEAQESGDPAAVAEAQRGVEQATRDSAKAALDLEVATRELASGVADGSVDLDEGAAALDRWAARGDITEEQAAELKEEFGHLRDRAQEFEGEYAATVTADTAQAEAALERVRVANERVMNQAVAVAASAFAPAPAAPRRRARGGPVWSGEPFLVGEEGPELVTFGSGGHVTPAAETRQMLSGGGGADTVHVHLHLDKRVVADAVIPLIRDDRRAKV